jgi:hypothetical protein
MIPAVIPVVLKDKQNWYCIKFDVPKNKNITALEFSQKMNSFLEQINEFNHSIVSGTDETYTVTSYIEDFESGSIKWWLSDKLSKVDDKAIDKFVDSPIKTTIAGILKVCKKKSIEYLSSSDFKQNSPEERRMKIINPIIQEIGSKQEELNRNILSPKISIDENRLLKSLSNMSKISKELEENVSFIDSYELQEKQVRIFKDFNYNEATKEQLSEEETEEKDWQTTNEIIDIYTLLTPTSKEDCKWELEENDSKIKCKIEDLAFFNQYKLNQVKLGGNEKLKVKMKIETFLEKRSNEIKKEYTILEVIEVFEEKNLFNYND